MRTKADVLVVTIVAGVVILAGVLLRMAPNDTGASQVDSPLPAEDAARIDVEVNAIDAASIGSGLISRADALAAASRQLNVVPALPDAYLQLMTDPSSSRGPDPITDRPMWVVRYSGLSVTSPGGRELHYAYVIIDARTGVEHHTSWSP